MAALVLVLDAAGMVQPFRDALVDWRFRALERAASGEIVFVEIDPRSIERVGTWPWPRRLHARLIERLQAAGAAEIAFDIDFSTASNPDDDAAFERALEAADGSVILPIFRQVWSEAESERREHVNRPLPRFSRHAWTATVNVMPDPDGRVRHYAYGDDVDGTFHPSVPALYGGDAGNGAKSFVVDFAIRTDTVPRISYIEVIDGTAAHERLAGKKILVGASADELHDSFALPSGGVTSGAMLQILAAESVLQGRALAPTSRIVTLCGLGILIAIGAIGRGRMTWRGHALASIALIVVIEAAATAIQSTAPVVVDTVAWHLAIVLSFAVELVREVDLSRIVAAIARVEAANTRAVLARVIADNFAGIVVVDDDRRIRTASAVAASLLGHRREPTLVGREIGAVLPAPLAGACAQALDEKFVREHGDQIHEAEIDLADGRRAVLEFVATPSVLEAPGNGSPKRRRARRVVTLTFRDVTAIRRAAAATEAAARAALEASRAKTHFIANMSHELRTPLNAIIGFSEIIAGQSLGPVGHNDYAEFAGEIRDGGRRLLGRLNAMIELARLDAGTWAPDYEETDVGELVRAGVAEAGELPESDRHVVDLETAEDLPMLSCDRRAVTSALTALLSNAFKFSEPGEPIRIVVRRTADAGLAIEVHDSGAGIAAELDGKVLQPFFQADADLSRGAEGCGVGLTLAAGYLAAHGGRLDIESEPGRGTLARMALPAARLVPAEARVAEAPRNAAAA